MLNALQGARAGDAERVHRLHLSYGYQGLGYHFLIGADGQIYEGRPLALQGAPVRDDNRGKTWRQPGDRERQAAAELRRAMTRAPRYLAYWIAASPTPPAAAWKTPRW